MEHIYAAWRLTYCALPLLWCVQVLLSSQPLPHVHLLLSHGLKPATAMTAAAAAAFLQALFCVCRLFWFVLLFAS
jgi:hypothetical protein